MEMMISSAELGIPMVASVSGEEMAVHSPSREWETRAWYTPGAGEWAKVSNSSVTTDTKM